VRPEEILATLAQLGVAVAGFSGIVVVLGSRARESVALDSVLLNVILTGGVGVVLWALIPLLMLSAQLPERTVWIVASAGWSAQQVLVLMMRAFQARRILLQATRPDSVFFALALIAGVGTLALQIGNVFWLSSAWPHLTGLAWWLMFSFVVFLRLMRINRGQG